MNDDRAAIEHSVRERFARLARDGALAEAGDLLQARDEGKFDFGFAVDWMRKDLGLVLDEAKRNGARLPVTALVDQFYADVQALAQRLRGR